jgi:hypothetical protein
VSRAVGGAAVLTTQQEKRTMLAASQNRVPTKYSGNMAAAHPYSKVRGGVRGVSGKLGEGKPGSRADINNGFCWDVPISG